MSSKFENNLLTIIDDLQNHIITNKDEFFESMVKKRLNDCLQLYHNQIDSTIDRLNNYDDKYILSMIKILNKD